MLHGGRSQHPSITATLPPRELVKAERCPHRSATSWSMFNMRPEKRNGRSLLSQASRVVRRALRGRSTTPLRISPKVRTLKNKSSSSVASIHVVTFGAAFGLMSSEMTFVSNKNPLRVRPPGHNRIFARDRWTPWPEVTRQKIAIGSSAAWLARLTARSPPRQG
jgi:hypothetical protein